MPQEVIVQLAEVLKNTNHILQKLPQVQPDHAAQIIFAVVPLAGTVLGVVLMFFFMLWQYRLRKELIRSGQLQTKSRNIGELALLAGILCVGTGIPMSVLFLIIDGFSYPLLGGLIPLFVGGGLITFYIISRNQKQ